MLGEKMRNILLIANDSTYVYNLRREVIEALLENGDQVTVLCEKKQHVEKLQKMGCRMQFLAVKRHGKNPFEDLALKKAYRAAIEKANPDVVLTYNIKPNVYAGMVCAKLHVPYLVNVCGLGTPVETPGLMQVLTVALYKMGVRKASCVFFQNSENEAFFNQRNMAPGHHHLIPGSGVNTKRFQVLDYPKEGPVEFLFISRVMKEKGIDQYLEAAQMIRKKYPNTVFHILGGCDDESYQEKLGQLQAQGIVQYHGQQSSVLPFHEKSSCTVHPTYYPEGMSNVLLESAACGRPIITTDRSGCREIIDDGVNGFICRQKDTADLVKQIEKFLALTVEQRREMGLAGRAKVEREFDRRIVVEAYLQEIEAACKK